MLKSLNHSLKTLSLTNTIKSIGKMIYPLIKMFISMRLSPRIALSQKKISKRKKYKMIRSALFAL